MSREANNPNETTAGDAAAMREALVALRDAARDFCHQILNSRYNDIMDEYKCRERGFPALLDLRYAIPKANFALAKPPRNCDVGTKQEQAKRLNEWCNGRHCVNCQFKGGWPDECKLAWAQMPYEEGGAK